MASTKILVMKTRTSFLSSFASQSFIPVIIVLLYSLSSSAQTFYLKDIVMGNRYAPQNVKFVYETPWYYDYSIKTNRVDSRGGDIELHVVLKSIPDCKKIYHITWNFSKDVSMVSCGEKIYVDVVNTPIAASNCQWDWVFHNPSSLHLSNGPSGMTYNEASKDIKASYNEYVFLHYPGQIIQGEPQFTDQPNHHLHHAEQLSIVVCSRQDMAKEANAGHFHFNLDSRGISFDIDYVFSREPAVVLPQPITEALQNPVIQHNIQNAEGVYWMSIQVPGFLKGYNGKQIQLVIRFVDANDNFLSGNTADMRYVDASGNVATGTGLIHVNTDQFDLGSLQMWMPYYGLNLPYSGGVQAHELTAFAELFVDGQLKAQSLRIPLRVVW